jgi:hypothetical protein
MEIRQLYLTGCYSFNNLASSFALSKAGVQAILEGVNWRWLLGEGEEAALARMRAQRFKLLFERGERT